MSRPSFDYFILFAEMRTGSNFLENNLNMIDGISCMGELYNPVFIGKPDTDMVCGVDLNTREENPLSLIEAIKDKDGINGFRFFFDHDPRILDHVMADPKCAKIILTRNPVESYISYKIADEADQWRLMDATHIRKTSTHFSPEGFETYFADLQAFQIQLQQMLQKNGQAAFYINYDDINDRDAINGISKYLGLEAELERFYTKEKIQNPHKIEDKIENFDEMRAALSKLDIFNLYQTPNFEPRRGPAVPSYVAAAKSPLLFYPIAGPAPREVEPWLAALDAAEEQDLKRNFTQNSFRSWKKSQKNPRSFTVVTHPLERAHYAFCTHLLTPYDDNFELIKTNLHKNYRMRFPEDIHAKSYSIEHHKELFLRFLKFLKGNLNTQTSVQIMPIWASQHRILQGMGDFQLPDYVLRREDLETELGILALRMGKASAPDYSGAQATQPYQLSDIYDEVLEKAARQAYKKDYVMFGYDAWDNP